MAEPIDLLAITTDEGPEVTLPGGRTVRVRLFDAADYRLHQQCIADTQAGRPDGGVAVALLQRAIPDLTTEERETLSGTMIWFIGQCAARKGQELMAMLRKNGQRLPPLSVAPVPAAGVFQHAGATPSTTSETPLPRSGRSKAGRGKTSRGSRSI